MSGFGKHDDIEAEREGERRRCAREENDIGERVAVIGCADLVLTWMQCRCWCEIVDAKGR